MSTHSPPRSRPLLLAGLAFVLALGAVAAWRGRELAGDAIAWALSRAGLETSRVEVRSLRLGGASLGPLRLGGPNGPAADAIEIEWSSRSLLRGRLARVRLEGVSASASLARGTLAIDGLPPRPASPGPWTLPFETLEIAAARLALAAGPVRMTATLDATVTQTAAGLAGRAAIDSRATPPGGAPIHLVADLPEWRLAADGARLMLARARLALPAHQAELTSIDATLDIGAATALRLTGALRHDATPALVAPLSLALDGRREGDALSLSGRAVSGDGALTAALGGRHDLARGRGSAKIDVAPMRFAPDGRQPADLFPIAGDALTHVGGTVALRGRLSWCDALASALTVTLADVGFDRGPAEIRDLDGTVALDRVWPPRTAGPQRVTARIGVAGLPQGTLDLRFGLSGERLRLHRASLGLAGGTLALADVILAQGRPIDTALMIDSLDLGAVLTLIGVEGLSGSGALSGRVPMRIDGAAIAIVGGRLAATGPGVVRYTGGALPDLEGVAGESLRLVREALADFHYTALTLSLDRDVGGAGAALVRLEGANPAVLDNHPFVFNVRLETNFDRLAAVLLDGYAAADALLRRAARP